MTDNIIYAIMIGVHSHLVRSIAECRKFLVYEPLAKLSDEGENRHSGQAKRDPESRIFKQFWIPAFAGMTERVTFASSSNYINL